MDNSILSGIQENMICIWEKRRERVNLGLRGEDITVLDRVESSRRQRDLEDRPGSTLDISDENEILAPRDSSSGNRSLGGRVQHPFPGEQKTIYFRGKKVVIVDIFLSSHWEQSG